MIHKYGQSLESYINNWFKLPAYALILLRDTGYPCVFYGDYYEIPNNNIAPTKDIKTLIELRKEKAYGMQVDYLDNPNVIGWTRMGDDEHLKSGLAVLISNKYDTQKRMFISTKYAGEKFIDSLGNCEDEIIIDNEGYGIFKVKAKSISIWVEA